MKAINLIAVLSLAIFGGLLTSCASLYDNEAVPVVIEDNTPPVRYVKNRNDPVEVIQFARTLSASGKNLDSARIYLDAAKRFESVDGKFELDCRKEAVREFWYAGEYVKARELFNELDAEQDIYRRAAEEEDLNRLRMLLETSKVARKRSE